MKNIRIQPVTPADCARCPTHKVDLFSGLHEQDRVQLLRHFHLEQRAPRSVIYNEGERGESLYILRAGVVKHVRVSASGDERIVRLSVTGNAIGLSLLAGGAYGTTAVTVTATELCRIPMKIVETRMLEFPEFGLRVVRESQAQLREAEEFLTELSTGAALERVARLLLFLGDHAGEGHCLILTREEMGALLGITTETASRVIAEFRREGVVTERGDGTVSCDRGRLAALAAA
ncbi:MAG TPA: Crp/Fnr family transcriptional regulator [Pelomicrobium sp.]|nr:Crp/Fnr family transcriptional regulator [Pelomicrobium sp.]